MTFDRQSSGPVGFARGSAMSRGGLAMTSASVCSSTFAASSPPDIAQQYVRAALFAPQQSWTNSLVLDTHCGAGLQGVVETWMPAATRPEGLGVSALA